MLFPEEGLVYDYQLIDGGVSAATNQDDDDADEAQSNEVNLHTYI